MNTLAALAAAVRTRIVRLAEGLASRVAAFMASLDRLGLPTALPVAGAGIKTAVVLASVLVAVAGFPLLTPLALIGLKHLAVACVLDVALRSVPWGHLATCGRGLRTAAAIGLLWLAAASFDAGRTLAPRPVAAAAVPTSVTDVRSAFVTAVVPVVEPASSAVPPVGWRAARARRLKAATQNRA